MGSIAFVTIVNGDKMVVELGGSVSLRLLPGLVVRGLTLRDPMMEVCHLWSRLILPSTVHSTLLRSMPTCFEIRVL